MTTLTVTYWSPRPRPLKCGIPFPRSTNVSPDCVPGGMVSSSSPKSVGTLTVAPSAACGNVMGTSQYKSSPLRVKTSWGAISTTM